MGYEAKAGVLTEEDKVRLVLGNTGHDVDVPAILSEPMAAAPKISEEAVKDFNENPNPSLAEETPEQKAAAESREQTLSDMKDHPDSGGPSSHLEDNEGKGDLEAGEAFSEAEAESEPEEPKEPEAAEPTEANTAPDSVL